MLNLHYEEKHSRDKLDQRAKTGVLIGYAQNIKGYCIWLPKERTVKETKHIGFSELVKGYKSFDKWNDFQKPEYEPVYVPLQDDTELMKDSVKVSVKCSEIDCIHEVKQGKTAGHWDIRKCSTTNWCFEVWLKITLKDNTIRSKRLATIVSGQ